MNRHLAHYIAEHFLTEEVDELCANIDETIRPRRGPKSPISFRTVVVGLACAAIEKTRPHASAAAELLDGLSRELRELLGVPVVPSVHQIRRRLKAAERRCREAADGSLDKLCELLQWFADVVVDASVAPIEGPIEVAVDTTLFNAHTPRYKQVELESIKDKAKRRRLKRNTKSGLRRLATVEESVLRRHYDPEAAWRTIEKPSATKSYLGYAATSFVQTGGEFEQCLRVAIRPANVYDVPVAMGLLDSLLNAGIDVAHQTADRGFSQDLEYLAHSRALGIPITYDLKEPQRGFTGYYRGLLVIDGGLYLPSLPTRLWNLTPPGPSCKDERRIKAYKKAVEERWIYAFKPNQKLPSDPRAATKIQLYSPYYRPPADGVPSRCKSRPDTMANNTARVCRSKECRKASGNQPAQGCAIDLIVWEAESAPLTWQVPAYNTPPWKPKYNPRGGVERDYNKFKCVDGVEFAPNVRVRGVVMVSMFGSISMAMANLQLRYRAARRKGYRAPDG